MVMLVRRFVQYTLVPRGAWTLIEVADWSRGKPGRPKCAHLAVSNMVADIAPCARYATGYLQVGGCKYGLCSAHARRVVSYRTAILPEDVRIPEGGHHEEVRDQSGQAIH